MPSTRHVSREQPLVVSSKSSTSFDVPNDTHLLITTPKHIFAWDSAGLHPIFTSSKNGIVAAREANDGSGLLAVAGKHVVVLHDTKRGQEKSWGLEAEEDEVRHLEYTADAKSLFLSTNLTKDIQRYSTVRSKLLTPAGAHASPPVALAVSPTGQLMVSASDGPPVVYLHHLTHNSPPLLVECRASDTAVSVIAFHPERPNIFLLGFRDGTLAAFDTTRIGRYHNGSFSNQESVSAGELAHITKLHRTAPSTSKVLSVTGAAFLPGYKTRAVSVGGDGRCRLVDFIDGGVVLRTWHAGAPVTSVAVLSQKSRTGNRNRSAGSQASHVIGGPTSTNNIIAIGRIDGRLNLYDSVGLLLCQKSLGATADKIISVEWLNGPSPRPIAASVVTGDGPASQSVMPYSPLTQEGTQQARHEATSVSAVRARRATNFEHVGLPPALLRPKEKTKTPNTGATRKFTIHPDELEEGTVRHTSIPNEMRGPNIAEGPYLDLFSAVKASPPKAAVALEARVASLPRARPRVSSQTFVKSPDPTPAVQGSNVAKGRNISLFPSTDSGSDIAQPSPGTTPQRLQTKKIEPRPTPIQRLQSMNTAPGAAAHNAKVLANLRKMSAVHPVHRPGGVLSGFGPDKRAAGGGRLAPSPKRKAKGLFKRPTDHIETDLDSLKALRIYEHAHERQTWPEDSNQDTSLDGDIWLTSGSEDDTRPSRRRRELHGERPPARQTSRSRVDSKGTQSTSAQQPASVATSSGQYRKQLDGSTDEEMYTAETHLSPDGTFSPSSTDVRKLFPRTSSLSPGKRRSPNKRSQRPSHRTEKALQTISPNAAIARQPKSPWARAKAAKHISSAAKKSARRPPDDTTNMSGNENHDREGAVSPSHCYVCSPTAAKVQFLQGEVARLNGEVLALKAALRRHGMSVSKRPDQR